MDRDGQRLGIGRTAGEGPASDGGDVPHVAGHVPDHLQGRRRAPERQSDGHPAEHAALRDELSGHRGLHRLAAVEPAPFALDRRRLFGAGLHLFGTHVPDHGHVARHAVPEQALPVHLLHRHLRRSDAAGRPGRLLAARHVLHVAVHCLTASVPAAPADHLHGGKILGEVIA